MKLVVERNWKMILGRIGRNISKGHSSPIQLKKNFTVKCNSTVNKSLYTIAKLHFKHEQPLHCYICKVKPSHIEYDGALRLVFRNGFDATIEHVQPKSKNGKNHIDNYKIACQDCNAKRGNVPLRHEKLLHLYVKNHNALAPYAKKVDDFSKTVEEFKKPETYGRLWTGLVKTIKSEIIRKKEAIPSITIVRNYDEYDYYH